MPNKFISDKWKVKFEEKGNPLWLIVAVMEGEDTDEYDIVYGIACAPTGKDALNTVPEEDAEECLTLEAHNLLSLIGRSHTLGLVSDLVDTLEDK